MHRTLLALCLLALPFAAHADEPRLQSIAPSRGPTSGGTLVQLVGQNFDLLGPGAVGVLFGNSPATGVQIVSPTLITAVSPFHSENSVNVRLSLDGVAKGNFGRRAFYYELGNGGPTSTTTTTTLFGATTTTTLPCGGCADGDPCTIDSCVNLTCQHRQATTLTDLVGQANACTGQAVPERVGERFILGCDLVREGRASADQTVARRRFGSAARLYSRGIRAARRAVRRRLLTRDCADGLGGLLDSARVRARALKGP